MEQTYHATRKVFDTLSDICAICPKHYNARISAAVVHKKRIISIGTNGTKSDPWQIRYSSRPENIFLHAEIQAIKRAYNRVSKEKLASSVLYVCRLIQPNDTSPFVRALAKPCDGCKSAIAAFGIKRVYYTISDHVCGRWDLSDITGTKYIHV